MTVQVVKSSSLVFCLFGLESHYQIFDVPSAKDALPTHQLREPRRKVTLVKFHWLEKISKSKVDQVKEKLFELRDNFAQAWVIFGLVLSIELICWHDVVNTMRKRAACEDWYVSRKAPYSDYKS